ncbi:nucleotidyltransferase family protein [bacterium]|jgi:mannose-1-phosphate guanylyltransferase|nr:nucleotidyltransferase family protein [bacterium]
MRALLLAAGYGKRLSPITNYIPKCLVPINGKPLIDYWLEQLSMIGIERFLINTHYLSDQVEEHISKSLFRNKIDLVYEDSLLMTGGTILKNHVFFKGKSFMVIHADNLSFCNFSNFISTHKNRGSNVEITMMTFDTDSPRSCGIIKTDRHGIVEHFYEKQANPVSSRANAAVYIMEHSVIKYMESIKKEEIDISLDVIPEFIGRIGTFYNNDYHRDIGNLASYSLAQIELYRRMNP